MYFFDLSWLYPAGRPEDLSQRFFSQLFSFKEKKKYKINKNKQSKKLAAAKLPQHSC